MGYTSKLWRRRARSLKAGLILLACNAGAFGSDIYNPSIKQLTIPSVVIGNATYTNMVVTPASILCVQGGTPNGSKDTYNPADQQLFIPSVMVGGTPYANVLVTVGSLISIGSVTGADIYNGVDLTIPSVQVQGGGAFSDVVVTVSGILSAGGGMPASFADEYNAVNDQLTIAAVQVGNRVYTNAIITVGKVVSSGSSQPANTELHPNSGNGGTCNASPLNFAVATLPGGGPGGTGLFVPIGGMGAIAAFVQNISNQDLFSVDVTATTGATALPLTITMCLGSHDVNVAGTCSAPPTATLTIPSIAPGSAPDYANDPIINLQVTASAPIAISPANQIDLTFKTSSGTVVGSTSVPVSASAVPIGIAVATSSGNGVVTVPVGGEAAFSVAANNLGTTPLASINVSTSTTVPISVTLCQTNPNDGACLAAPGASVLLQSLAADATVTLSVFVSAPTAIPNDPAANLLFVNFEQADGTVVGSTSVGVATN